MNYNNNKIYKNKIYSKAKIKFNKYIMKIIQIKKLEIVIKNK